MPCIDRRLLCKQSPWTLWCAIGAAVVVAACGSSRDRAPGESSGGVPAVVAPAKPAPLPTVTPTPGVTRSKSLPEPKAMSSWADVRRQAAERMVAANADITYIGKVPDMLLAIPVLEIELNGDGSIRRIEVLREPRQAKDTLQIAADAVRRAGPFGNVSKLPKPWKFVETFLFNDARKFKPRTLDS